MNTYIVNIKLCYLIIESGSESEAWAEAILTDTQLEDMFWTAEDLQQELLKKGFKTIRHTKLSNVFKIIK